MQLRIAGNRCLNPRDGNRTRVVRSSGEADQKGRDAYSSSRNKENAFIRPCRVLLGLVALSVSYGRIQDGRTVQQNL